VTIAEAKRKNRLKINEEPEAGEIRVQVLFPQENIRGKFKRFLNIKILSLPII
jgi:hypothetical protein